MRYDIDDYNDRSIFLCKNIFCCFTCGRKASKIGPYLAGMLFGMGWWAFIDGLLQLGNLENRQVAPGIEDWVSGILATFGFIVVSLIDKSSLKSEYSTYGDESYIGKARLFLFLGFTLLAGGMAGSVSVLVTKYIYHDGLDILNMYLGIMDVVQNFLILSSTTVLWFTQSNQVEYFTI